LRHAWGEIGEFGAGQTWSLLMDPDVFPDTIDYWGPVGMAFYRNAQMRWTPVQTDSTKFAVAIEHPGAGIDAGKLPELDPAFGAATAWNQFPDVTAQFRKGGDWGHFQVSGIARVLGVQAPGLDPVQEFGWGVVLATGINLFDADQLLLQVVYGDGIANYMNDGGVDLAPADDQPGAGAEAVNTIGWLAYYNRTWNDKFTSTIGFGEHRQDNTDGQLDNAMALIQYGNVNVLYKPIPEFLVGPEFVWGRRENKNGDDGTDMRVQVSAKYKFGATVAAKE
jgi:hypothetical protein